MSLSHCVLTLAAALLCGATAISEPLPVSQSWLAHGAPIAALDYDAASQRVLTADTCGLVRLWDLRTGVLLLELRPRAGAILDAKLAPGGSGLVTVHGRRAVYWNTETGRARDTIFPISPDHGQTLPGGDEFLAARFDRTGEHLYLPGYAGVSDYVSGEYPRSFLGFNTFWAAFDAAPTPGGDTLVVFGCRRYESPAGSGRWAYTVVLSVVGTSRGDSPGVAFHTQVLQDGNPWNGSVAVHPAGGTMFFSGLAARGVLGYRLEPFGEVREIPARGARRVHFTPAGDMLLSVDDGVLRRWTLTGALLDSTALAGDRIVDVAAAGSGGTVVAATEGGRIVVLGEAVRGGTYPVPGAPVLLRRTMMRTSRDSTIDVIFSPDTSATVQVRLRLASRTGPFSIVSDDTLPLPGSSRVSATIRFAPTAAGIYNDTLLVYRKGAVRPGRIPLLGEGLRLRLVDPLDTAVRIRGQFECFSPDGSRLFVSSNHPDSGAGTLVYETRTASRMGFFPGRYVRAWSGDTLLVSNWYRDTLWFCRAGDGTARGQVSVRSPGGAHPYRFALSFDLKLAATTDNDSLWIWDLANGRLMQSLELRTGRIEGLAFSMDGRSVAASGTDSLAVLIDAVNGSQLGELRLDQPGGGLRLSPDGSDFLILAGSALVRWKYDGSEVIDRLRRPAEIWRFWCSTTGRYVAGVSVDTTVAIWERGRTTPLYVLNGESRLSDLAFSPDEKRLMIAGSSRPKNLMASLETGATLSRWQAPGSSVEADPAFRPDGRWLAEQASDTVILLGPDVAMPYVHPVSGDSIDVTTATSRDTVVAVSFVNIGRDDLDATALVEPEGSAFSLAGNAAVHVPAGGTAVVHVRYSPLRVREKDVPGFESAGDPRVRAMLRLMLDADGPLARVRLYGSGSGPSLHADEPQAASRTCVVRRGDHLEITLPNLRTSDARLQVVDVLGRVRASHSPGRFGRVDVDISGLESGEYIVLLDDGGQVMLSRFCVVR